jgi:L-arginine dehydrogenase
VSRPLVLGAARIETLIDRVDVPGVMRELFASLAAGRATQPLQTLALFPDGTGDFITYLGALAGHGVFGAKLSPYIVRPEGVIVTAWTLLMSMRDGQPLALCDAGRLTVERTAATTALAVDLLARPDAARLAVIGCGAVGRAHVRHVQGLRPWREIRVHSRTLAADPERRKSVELLDGRVAVADDLESAVADADVVMLCTSSGTPVLDPVRLRRPTLITSVSTNAPQAHEVPPSAIPGMEVYCDYRSTTPASAGELQLAVAQHGWQASAVRGDLPELVAARVDGGEARQAPSSGALLPTWSRHVFFRSIGLGLEDIALANAIFELERGEVST